jgi:hypothetical protein
MRLGRLGYRCPATFELERSSMRVVRLGNGPIITPHMDARMGDNVNGPSLIRVPDWVERPLGRYYLYFGHHDGEYIRLAYADDLIGPWRTHEPGVLPLAESTYAGHIASPDVHVDHASRTIRMYFHGSDTRTGGGGAQHTRLALSADGLHFRARPENLGRAYIRAISIGGWWYAVGMPGQLYRSPDGLTNFVEGPRLGDPDQRHVALRLVGTTLQIFSTTIGDCPERILLSTVDTTADWRDWTASPPTVVLEPELPYEGGNEPLEPSKRGLIHGPVRQLRDPAIFEENGRAYLIYSVAGESGLALAEVLD